MIDREIGWARLFPWIRNRIKIRWLILATMNDNTSEQDGFPPSCGNRKTGPTYFFLPLHEVEVLLRVSIDNYVQQLLSTMVLSGVQLLISEREGKAGGAYRRNPQVPWSSLLLGKTI